MGFVDPVLVALWLMLPAYVGNMIPVFVGGGTPIDFGRSWSDGRRVLGDGKTWRGLVLGPLVTVALSGILQLLARPGTWWGSIYPQWGPSPWWAVMTFALAFGALAGDAVESFVKRRTGRDRGERWIPFDQLDFVVGALVVAAVAGWLLRATGATAGNLFLELFTWPRVLVILVLTPGFHLLVNFIGWKIGAKKVPW
jgi:CDP-2,3-bis-(O-geranylgeranyl)-sn-glycerol synthase